MKKFFILLLTLIISTTFSFSQVNLKNGLVACYPFNANANDASGNGNDGTVVGASLTTDRFGKANSAYSFNGESYISITPDQFENTNYSYALWVNLDALPVESDNNSFFSVGGPGADQNLSVLYKYFSETNTGFSGGGYNAGNPVVSNNLTGSLPNTGRWYHLVSTRDNNTVKLYVDGVLISNNSGNISTNGTNAAYSNPAYAVIGSRVGQNGYFQFTKGSIDDVYIYNRAITAEEVTALYQSTKTPTVDLKNGLVACYPFNGNASDETKNGHNGTVNGATLATDRFGKINSAYNFDGSSFIQLANPNDFMNNSFTYSAWVKVATIETSSSIFFAGVGIGMTHGTGALNKLSWAGILYNNENVPYDQFAHVYNNNNINEWHHLVLVRDATQAKIYVDGVLERTSTTTVPTTPNYLNYPNNIGYTYRATIGTRPAESNIQFFNGIIDDIYIYNRAITAEEVTALYQNSKSIPCEGGVIACHPFSVIKTK